MMIPVKFRDDTGHRLSREARRLMPLLRPSLLRWFRKHARELPWRVPPLPVDSFRPPGRRLRRSPYAAWVAEIMLQQTQVITVIPYFEKWMERFPDVIKLANAPEAEVLRFWAGLGYYARARNLQRAAQAIVKAGRYPVSLEAWKALPGIGPYTAGAITSLAQDLPEAIVDGNVIRVFSRVFGLGFIPQDGVKQNQFYWDLARTWAVGVHPGDVNEGLMELGALICTPANPSCHRCPFASNCRARKHKWQDLLPPVKQRARIEAVNGAAVVIAHRGRVLMEMRTQGSFLAGHLMFPLYLGEEQAQRDKDLEKLKETKVIRHSIMNHRYVIRVLQGSRQISSNRNSAHQWVPMGEIEGSLTSSLARKIWKVAQV